MRKIKTAHIKKAVSMGVIVLIAAAFSFSLFNYGEKIVVLKLSKNEAEYVMRLLDDCGAKNNIADSIKLQIQRQ